MLTDSCFKCFLTFSNVLSPLALFALNEIYYILSVCVALMTLGWVDKAKAPFQRGTADRQTADMQKLQKLQKLSFFNFVQTIKIPS